MLDDGDEEVCYAAIHILVSGTSAIEDLQWATSQFNEVPLDKLQPWKKAFMFSTHPSVVSSLQQQIQTADPAYVMAILDILGFRREGAPRAAVRWRLPNAAICSWHRRNSSPQ